MKRYVLLCAMPAPLGKGIVWTPWPPKRITAY